MPTKKAPKTEKAPKTKGSLAKEFHCCIKELPESRLMTAYQSAVEINPNNRPRVDRINSLLSGTVMPPEQIAVITTKWWGSEGVHLGVSFMDTNNQALINDILSYMNVWSQYANISFRWSQSDGEIRISRGVGGFWSYLGLDCLQVPKNQQTMNLQGITVNTDPKEKFRVIVHETGHACGCPHEHLRRAIIDRLDVSKTLRLFEMTQGWDEATVRANLLTPVEEQSLMGSPIDETSIMTYPLPGSITKDGRPIVGGSVLSAADKEYMAKYYPKTVTPPPPGGGTEPVQIVITQPGTYVLKTTP